MSFGRRVPALRVDDLPDGFTKAALARRESPQIVYSFSTDPEREQSLESWGDLSAIIGSIGCQAERASVRLHWSAGGRRLAADVLGSAPLDRLIVRWEDSALEEGLTARPWYVTYAEPARRLAKVPIGKVPHDFDSLADEQVDALEGLDFAWVPEEAVLSEAAAVAALETFFASGGAEESGMLVREKK